MCLLVVLGEVRVSVNTDFMLRLDFFVISNNLIFLQR